MRLYASSRCMMQRINLVLQPNEICADVIVVMCSKRQLPNVCFETSHVGYGAG
jgi:hypothetical protein